MSRRSRPKDSYGDKITLVFIYAALAMIFIVVAYPLIYVISSSFSGYDALIGGKVWLWPVNPTLLGYKFVLTDPDVLRGFMLSVFYTVAGTALSVSLTMMMAYPLSRKDFYGRRVVIFLLLFAMIFNGGLIPFYLVVKQLGMINTPWAMIVPSALGIFQVILAKTFLQSSVSMDLFEAAQLDGCGNTRFFIKIVIPLSKPIIAVLVLLFAVGNWNSYFNALIFLNSPNLFPLQLVLRGILVLNNNPSSLTATNVSQFQELEAMRTLTKYSLIVITSAPMLLLYPFTQKYFVKGVMLGSIKD